MVLGRKVIVGHLSSLISGSAITFPPAPLLLLAALLQLTFCGAQVFENILRDTSGSFQVRNNPYPHNDCSEKWFISLAEREHVVFTVDGNYRLDPNDEFYIEVNSINELDLRNQRTPAKTDWQVTYIGPASVYIYFWDKPPNCNGNRPGPSVKYQIRRPSTTLPGKSVLAPTACGYGTCQVDRNSSNESPASCSCPAGFSGKKCNAIEQQHVHNGDGRGLLTTASGKFPTPNFPVDKPNSTYCIWSMQLQQFETVEFFRAMESAPRFETCCDFFNLYENGNHVFSFSDAGAGQRGSSLVVIKVMDVQPKLVSIVLSSNALVKDDRGYEVEYRITCTAEACLNGGTCEIQRKETYAGPVVCKCPKEFEGPQCETSVRYTHLVNHLWKQTGIIETPLFPENYPVAQNITWYLHLQRFEMVTFRRLGDRDPSFESCCDFFSIYSNDSQVSDLSTIMNVSNGSTLFGPITTPMGKTAVAMRFFSDGRVTGRGIRFKYEVECMAKFADPEKNACLHGGQCSLDRNTSRVGPVKCRLCGKEFHGPRCELPVIYMIRVLTLSDASGSVETPQYPRKYPVGQDITWVVNLQPFESIVFTKHDDLTPDFEAGSDFLKLYVNVSEVQDFSTSKETKAGSVLRRVSSPNGLTKVTMHFYSDGANVGTGVKIDFRIVCLNDSDHPNENACLNGGICNVARTPTSIGPVNCQCPKQFYGNRCQFPTMKNREQGEIWHSQTRIASGMLPNISCPDIPGPYQFSFSHKPPEFIRINPETQQRQVSLKLTVIATCHRKNLSSKALEEKRIWTVDQLYGTWQLTNALGKSCKIRLADESHAENDTCQLGNSTQVSMGTVYDERACRITSALSLSATDSAGNRLVGKFQMALSYRCLETPGALRGIDARGQSGGGRLLSMLEYSPVPIFVSERDITRLTKNDLAFDVGVTVGFLLIIFMSFIIACSLIRRRGRSNEQNSRPL